MRHVCVRVPVRLLEWLEVSQERASLSVNSLSRSCDQRRRDVTNDGAMGLMVASGHGHATLLPQLLAGGVPREVRDENGELPRIGSIAHA